MYITDSLPEHLQELQEAASGLVDIISSYGFHGSVLGTSDTGRRVSQQLTEDGIVTDANPINTNNGIRISVFDGQTMWYTSTSRLEHVEREIHELCKGLTPNGERPVHAGYIKEHYEIPVEEDPSKVSLSDIMDRNSHVFELITARSEIVSASVGHGEDITHRVFADPNKLLSQTLRSVFFGARATVYRDDIYRSHSTQAFGADYAAVERPDSHYESFVERTIKLLDSETLEPGVYTVVLSPLAAGMAAHESFGHGYEADRIVQGMAAATDYIGKQVGSELVNIIDSSVVQSGRSTLGTYFFDDEGIASQPTFLIKNGILQPTPLTDFSSFQSLRKKIDGIRRTPNGRLEKYNRDIFPRMTVTYFVPDENGPTFDEMISGIKCGVYLAQSSGGMEDTKGWGLQLGPLIGYEIKNGKLTGKVFYGLSATGFVPDFLYSIDAVGRDIETSGGICGKGTKEIVNTSLGGPHIKAKLRLS